MTPPTSIHSEDDDDGRRIRKNRVSMRPRAPKPLAMSGMGLKSLIHPLPRWWLWTFYACIVLGASAMSVALSRPGRW
ncbi:MAG: cbb3-type cytochrome c oxidase N-terminal domain-containing protein [Parasphingorhabdus sp.]|nr:cbb3-type cytochrome c oxidase N-terminal domain-containing protein [Parasphingorhabdus sp.]